MNRSTNGFSFGERGCVQYCFTPSEVRYVWTSPCFVRFVFFAVIVYENRAYPEPAHCFLRAGLVLRLNGKDAVHHRVSSKDV